MKKHVPFTKQFPLTKAQAMELMWEYQNSAERERGRTFRTYLLKNRRKIWS